MLSKRPTVVWFQAITCNGNTHSLLSSNHSRIELFYKHFNLIYHPTLIINKSLVDILENISKIDFLLIEGAISDNKEFSLISDNTTKSLLNKLVLKSSFVIAVGSCASYGGIHKRFEQNNDISGIREKIEKSNFKNLKHEIINLTGCPVHPEWILQTLFILKQKEEIFLDEEFRPKELYSNLTHHGCTKNEYFEWKVEGNFGEKEGCLFYEQGCRGPMTHSSCNKILWNEVSSKTRVGIPCIGCTEPDFPRSNMFDTQKNIGIPQDVPLGVPKRAYLSITGIAKTFKIPRLNKKLID